MSKSPLDLSTLDDDPEMIAMDRRHCKEWTALSSRHAQERVQLVLTLIKRQRNNQTTKGD